MRVNIFTSNVNRVNNHEVILLYILSDTWSQSNSHSTTGNDDPTV